MWFEQWMPLLMAVSVSAHIRVSPEHAKCSSVSCGHIADLFAKQIRVILLCNTLYTELHFACSGDNNFCDLSVLFFDIS
jgi:hypothetical protein